MGLALRTGGTGSRFAFTVRPLLVPTSDDGLFAPDSVIRRVYAEPACLLGAGTALLLQLADPAVAAGVANHSDFEHRPLDRLLGTLYATNAVVFGSRDDARRVGRMVTGMHRRVRGDGYDALDPRLLAWVNATLLATAVQLHRRVVGPLDEAELDELAAQAAVVGQAFGCPIDQQPRSWKDFETWWDTAVERLEVGDAARRVAASLFGRRGLPLPALWWLPVATSQALAAATLPPSVRDGYGLPWGATERALAAATFGGARMTLSRVPSRMRRIVPELLGDPRSTSARSATARSATAR